MSRRKPYSGRSRRGGRKSSGHSVESSSVAVRSESHQNRVSENSHKARNNNGSYGNNPFPDPVILQEYEYASNGAAEKILQMAREEQQRRNEWEDKYLSFHRKSRRIGQLFGFIILIAVIFAYILLVSADKSDDAHFLAVTAFGSAAIASFFNFISRKTSRRPRYKRG